MEESKASPDLDAYLSLTQAALLAGVTRTGLLRRIQSGRLQHLRIGNTYATTLRWISESEKPGKMGRPPKQLPDHLRPADSAKSSGAGEG